MAIEASFFFSSSRRRHTRCLSDWSSDVCSSDLCSSLPQFAFTSVLAWSRVSGSVFLSQAAVSPMSIALYQADLMLRGALFDFMEHTRQSLSPIALNRNATAFLYYTLMFRMIVAIYVMSSLFRVLRFVLRRWRVLLR